MLSSLRRFAGILLDGAVWRSGHARYLLNGVIREQRSGRIALPDREALIAAAQWLERAQDATPDGGVSGRFALAGGWTSSYPETTGYIVPTFLSLASELGDPSYRDRAARCIDFLLDIQLDDGAFPGAEIAENRTKPSPFNTAQILHGLVAWHRETGDERTAHAARRAADWLVSCQDTDGAWRRHVYQNIPASYTAHASCWLAECGAQLGEQSHSRAAERHLDWVLGQLDAATGFFDGMGFSEAQQEDRTAFTHTIAYTICGVLFSSELLGREDGVAAACRAAEAVARRLELSRGLPGVLDHRWKPRGAFACLTGNAQMALIWLRLYRRDGDARLLNAALRAIDEVKFAQSVDSPNPGLRGGIAGSDPVWGDYMRMTVPNWAVKFFIDALVAKREALDGLKSRSRGEVRLPADLPRALPPQIKLASTPPRVVFYTRAGSTKLAQMLETWREYDIEPDAVIIEQIAEASLTERVRRRIRKDGFGAIQRFLQPRKSLTGERPSEHLTPPLNAEAACQRAGLRVIETGPLSHPDAVERVQSLHPDIAVHAGAGILRAPLLAVPRLGTLNAHMGILPFYRGMNVAEWACFGGDAIGPSVHLVSPGIDEGDILCIREIDVSGISSISELRRAVDLAQVELLGEVLRYVLRTGDLPPRYRQTRDQGKQFFRMHRELAATLEAELAPGKEVNHTKVSSTG